MSDLSHSEERIEINSTRAWSTPAQVAEHFQISAGTVYRKIHSGEWECTKLGNRIYRFSVQQIAKIEAGGTTPAPKMRGRTDLKEALKKMTGS